MSESDFLSSNPLACETPANILTITANDAVEVIRIAPDGRLFWRGREVDTDIDFRAAMLELAEKLVAPPPGIERLREAIQWVVRDASYKAPEQMGPAMAARWIGRLRSALAGSADETPACTHDWEQDAIIGGQFCRKCGAGKELIG